MPQPESWPGGWRPDAVVWDLDGTLVDSAPDLARALNALLAEQGHATHAVKAVRPMIGAGVGKLVERGFRAAGQVLEPLRHEALTARFMQLYTNCATDSTRLAPHAADTLRHLQNTGVRQALCTNKPLGVTRLILETLGIEGYFGSVVGGDSTPHKKPHPGPVQKCLQELGVRPEQALMVGDSGADVGAARAAGVRVVLVPDGYTGEPSASLGADLVVSGLAEIAAWSVWGEEPETNQRLERDQVFT
jgi:phosphoglycolate phosphatase